MNIRYAEALGQGGRGDQRVRATFGEPAVPYGSGYGARGYPGGGGGGGGFDRERDAERRDREMRQTGQTYKVFVGHLDQSISDADLKEYFSQFGTVAEATVMKERGQHTHARAQRRPPSVPVVFACVVRLFLDRDAEALGLVHLRAQSAHSLHFSSSAVVLLC